MASKPQLALARTHRGSTHLSKTTRQLVPAFLQKLYEIISDDSNADLIRWTEAGDALLVLDHERFARELLGRWFKHQNFNSFVRQLNMYGFRKVSHLQQGTLQSPIDAENWCFEHPSFRRNQPDLLCLIQRKKHSAIYGEANDTSASVEDQAKGDQPAASQLLQMHTILDEVAGIERHQAAISAELNELKRSNQVLWQEATAARVRLENHQDMINRILRFLAGVFGHKTASRATEDVTDQVISSPMPSKALRLMIDHRDQKAELGKSESTANAVLYHIDDDTTKFDTPPSMVQDETYQGINPSTLAAYNPPPLEPSSPATSEFASQAASATVSQSVLSPVMSPSLRHDQSPAKATVGGRAPSLDATHQPSMTPLLPAAGSSADADAMFQAFQRMLQSPAQLQQIFTALSPPSEPLPTGALAPSQLTTLPPTYDEHVEGLNPSATQPQLSLPYSTTADSLSSSLPLDVDTQRLIHNWKATEDIDKDVNSLQSNISSLLHTLGLDTASGNNSAHATGVPWDSMDGTMDLDDTTVDDGSLEALLNEYGMSDAPHTPQSGSLDTISSSSTSDAASPIASVQQDGDTATSRSRGEKRKIVESDVDLGKPSRTSRMQGVSSSGKSKRRVRR